MNGFLCNHLILFCITNDLPIIMLLCLQKQVSNNCCLFMIRSLNWQFYIFWPLYDVSKVPAILVMSHVLHTDLGPNTALAVHSLSVVLYLFFFIFVLTGKELCRFQSTDNILLPYSNGQSTTKNSCLSRYYWHSDTYIMDLLIRCTVVGKVKVE